jgi:DDE superfamily endonuclease
VLTLPPDIMALLTAFAPVFSRPLWRHVQVLLVGAILAPGRRMVTSVLRIMGLEQVSSFQTYHRVLNRAVWSSREVSRILLGLLIAALVPSGPIVLGIDETIERRRGRRITAAGYYRDPVRSTQHRMVKTRGLRWISLMVLVPLPWACRVWALPFFTVLAPAKRFTEARGRRHKTIAVWARQMICQVHRWCPTRSLVLVGDGEYAAMDLLRATRPFATIVTRLRLDAQLFAPPPPRLPQQRGRPRRVGASLPKLAARSTDPATVWTTVIIPQWYGQGPRTIDLVSDTAHWYNKNGQPAVPLRWVLIRDPQERFPIQALLCTDCDADPSQIITWFIMRWQVEMAQSHYPHTSYRSYRSAA